MSKIAHIADIHVRFGTRHDEMRTVLSRTVDDIRQQKPKRIVIAGDLFHMKITMSPHSIEIISEFLLGLSKIAPVDIIAGNHDLNMQQIEQGVSITPLIKLFENGYIIDKETKKLPIPQSDHGIYFFRDSGFYDIDSEITYGIYSCIDEEVISLEEKKSDRKYIAIYHGPIYGARMDNGYQDKRDNSIKPKVFDNFDLVLMGDFHEMQIVQEIDRDKNKPAMAYCGSILQNNYGESLDKGFLLWNLDDFSYQFRHIPNDHGFCKLIIAKGENIDDRLGHLKFSNNKKKTKIHITIEDYEENFSQERENQIVKKIKEEHGCEIVKVEHNFITKDILVDDENKDDDKKQSEQYIKEFIQSGTFDCNQEELSDIIALHSQINKELEINESEDRTKKMWYIDSVEISNIFSFPIKPTTIDFNYLSGITGLFGENYNGKSNVIKAIVWGLYKEILGGGDSKYLVNIYTDSNQGYVKIHLTIDDKKYLIHRSVKTTKSKDGKVSNSYGIIYKSLEFEYDDDGNIEAEKWEKEKSDSCATEKKEVENLIEESIGEFDDFTKVSLQVQGGKDDYINQGQQPKNALISRYLGLESYKMRYEYANEYFKEIKKRQKEIGDKIIIETRIVEIEKEIDGKTAMMDQLKKEKDEALKNKESLDNKILDLTKKIDKLDPLQISDENVVSGMIETERANVIKFDKAIEELEKWLSENFTKELPFKEGETQDSVSRELENQQKLFKSEKDEYIKIETWLKENVVKDPPKIIGIDEEIVALNSEITNLQNQAIACKGKACPTCGNEQKKADPEKEKECLDAIAAKKKNVSEKQAILNSHKEITKFNDERKNKLDKILVIADSLKNKKERIDHLKERIELFTSMKEIIEHNNKVKDNSTRLNNGKDVKAKTEKKIESLIDNLSKIKSNKDKKEKNDAIQKEIDELSETLKVYKLTFHNLESNINQVYGDLRVLESEIKTQRDRLESIREVERLFKKYSIYLQAMHRDGIPALIIRKKLPIINNKINSILQSVVNFKVELEIAANGDVSEYFYYSQGKEDMLPLQFASGAQKFVISIAIKDALHFISQLTKPSMCIIDEGFGTLGDRLSSEIVNILQYLKNKHRNVIFVTHKNEIKDFADNIIDVTKVKTYIPQQILDANPEAGTTKITIV